VFFAKLKKLCDERGISTYKACTDIGLNRAAVAKWKNGSIPSGSTATKLAAYFGVSVDYLLDNETKKAPTVSDERIDMSEVDVAFYGDYRELSDDDQKTIRDMVRLMRERRANQK